jgi:hypothetical protein
MADIAHRSGEPTALQWTFYVVKIVICVLSMGFIFPNAGSDKPGSSDAKKD